MTAHASSRQVLLKLADRCEREGPSRQLDLDIACGALGFESDSDFSVGRYVVRPAGRNWWSSTLSEIKAFTASLDAAVTLVPEGVCWAIKHLPPNPPRANVWSRDFGIEENAGGTTMALALCAASLRARAEAL